MGLGGGGYTEEWRMWHLSQQLVTRWSRSKSSSLCYKYNGKQADMGNNKQQHMPWSTSVGRKDCSSSMLCISPLNSSMKELRLAHTPQLRKAWQQDMPVSHVGLFRCLLCCGKTSCLRRKLSYVIKRRIHLYGPASARYYKRLSAS